MLVDAKLHVVPVVTFAVGGDLLIAADQRAHRSGDGGDVDVQIGRLVAIDVDADFGLAGFIRAVEVGDSGVGLPAWP